MGAVNGAGLPLPEATTLPFLGLGSEGAVRLLADALPHGLFTTDLEGRITYWNRAAERITGYSREEALGQGCSLLAGDSLRGCACGLGPIRCGMVEQQRVSKTCTVRTKDGRLLLIVKSAVPVFGPGGQPVGALETFTEAAVEAQARPVLPAGAEPSPLLSRAPAMLELDRMIRLVAGSDATVMILGESGTGKERVAEAIHAAGPWANGPLVRVSCSALEDPAAEAELTASLQAAASPGGADRGTLIVDEVADLSPLVQLRLLRALEERERGRRSDGAPAPRRLRLLCTSNRELKALVDAGRFRADLYFRLAVFPLRVPPLREREGDIALLGEAFLERRVPVPGSRRRNILPAALAALEACPWPGNVRELQNVLEFAALRAGHDDIDLAHLPPDVQALAPAAPQRASMPGRAEILAALEASGGNRAAAARRLGISRVTLWKRLKDGEGRG